MINFLPLITSIAIVLGFITLAIVFSYLSDKTKGLKVGSIVLSIIEVAIIIFGISINVGDTIKKKIESEATTKIETTIEEITTAEETTAIKTEEETTTTIEETTKAEETCPTCGRVIEEEITTNED